MTPSDDEANRGGPPWVAGTIEGDLEICWACGRGMSRRALFCHVCGAVQPPRDLDHFERLGLERRFDVELDELERKYQGFSKALDPNRFAARGARSQEFARRQADALSLARDALREPVRRARYLLEVLGIPPAPQADEEIAEFQELSMEPLDRVAVDRLAGAAARRVAESVAELCVAFRRDAFTEAATVLRRLEVLEGIEAEIRSRRASAPPPEGA